MAKNADIERVGLLLILTSPGGMETKSLAKKLLKFDREIDLSVSVTTRPNSSREANGSVYEFVDNEAFDDFVKHERFLEWAHVHGSRYGTLKSNILNSLQRGRDVVLGLDWQGTQQIKQVEPDIVRVYILPPSLEELRKRFYECGIYGEDDIERRMARAPAEISHWAEYDYLVVNDDPDSCAEKIYGILCSERLRRNRRIGLIDYIGRITDSTSAISRVEPAKPSTAASDERDEIIGRIRDLERALDQAILVAPKLNSTPGIGHNEPPLDQAMTNSEISTLKQDISEIEENVLRQNNWERLQAAAARLQLKALEIAEWAADKIDVFAGEFAKSLGQEAGKLRFWVGAWLIVSGKLSALIEIIQKNLLP
ncbi:MAG: guanylate kinase [Pseudomonadota bacterium]